MRVAWQPVADAVLVVVGLLGIVFLAQIAYVAVIHYALPSGRKVQVVEVRNESGLDVAEVRIPVCDHELSATKLRPGGSVALRFPIDCSDQYFRAWVRLASGREFDMSNGYMSGLSHRTVFSITGPDSSRFDMVDIGDADLAAGRR